MPLYRNQHLERKTARIQNEWVQVDPDVFRQLGVTPKKLAQLEHKLVGHIVLPGMPDYQKDCTQPILTPYTAQPQILVYCQVPNDVRLCLQWAHEFNWWVTCRSGGHSFANYSLNSGMVIDVSGLNHVVVDAANKRARIGPGAQFQQINPTLSPYKLHLPGGTCPDVACGGYMQGGGYGLTSRQYGIHCDSVLQVTMMLYDGNIVVANAEQNADLYWAVRGGTGNNFGVLLETEYRLYDLFQVWGFAFTWDMDAAPAVLRELQKNYMRQGAPRELGYMAVLAILQNRPTLVVMGLFHGKTRDGMDALASVRAIGKPELKINKRGAYAEMNEAIFAVLPGIPPNQPMLAHSGYVSKTLTAANWERICQQFANQPNPWNILGIEPYGGAINAAPPNGNAFIHRDVDMDLFAFAFLEQGQEKRDNRWLKHMTAVLQRVWDGQMYQNYPERDFPNFRWAYWGDAYNSLLFVKNKYDPQNFFHFEQSITPYPDAPDIQRSTAPSLFDDPKIVYEPYSSGFLK
jgi:FAD/FMN-containing dehydrogenase